jgi:hypothetical protein
MPLDVAFAGIPPRALRFLFIVWIAGVFAEFVGPFNVLHQPLYVSVVGWLLWTALRWSRRWRSPPRSSVSATRHASLVTRAPSTSVGRHGDITTGWNSDAGRGTWEIARTS